MIYIYNIILTFLACFDHSAIWGEHLVLVLLYEHNVHLKLIMNYTIQDYIAHESIEDVYHA